MAHSLKNLEETIQCTDCNYRCNSDTLMMHHKKEHNSRDRYQCEKCDYAACIMDDLQMPVNVHLENDSLMVSTIEESVESCPSQTLVALACNSCEKTFTTPKDLNEHALNHREVESCPQNVNAWELTSNDLSEVQTHTLGQGKRRNQVSWGKLV